MDRSRPALALKQSKRRTAWAARIVLSLPVLFLAVFFVYPLVAILTVSLTGDRASEAAESLFSSYTLRLFGFTFGQAILSTVLTLACALPCAYVFARFHFRGRSALLTLSSLPFVLPAVVVAAAFRALIGENGLVNGLLRSFNPNAAPINIENTLLIVLMAHVFFNFPLALRMIASYWMNQDVRIDEAARALGADAWSTWWHVTIPMLRPAILSAAMLVFTFCFTSFGIILILGGPRMATVEVEIYRQATGLFNLPLAAALSLAQLIVMYAAMLGYTSLARRAGGGLQSAHSAARSARTAGERWMVRAAVAFVVSLLFVPLVALVVQSFRSAGEFSVRNYALLATNPRGSVLFVPPLEAIGNSLLIAAVTSVLTLLLGVTAAYLVASVRGRAARFLDPLLMLPLATSAVTLGFGYLIAFGSGMLNLRSSVFVLPIIHTLVALPFVLRSALPALKAIPPSLREAAGALGASPIERIRLIDLPLLRRALVVGVTFAFTVSMGEFGATLFLARPESPTMPIVINRLLGQPGAANYEQALAMSTILLLICALCFLLIERFRTLGSEDF